jgi:NAD(P)-dependent dehydrogenase (short-subunit alcohol dehydrogenase family)
MLKKKNAFITGAGSSISKSIVDYFSQAYCFQKHKLTEESGFFHGNLADDSMYRELVLKLPKLDLMICCSGGVKGLNQKPFPDNCTDIATEDARAIFDRNFFSVFLTCKNLIKKMNPLSNIIIVGSAVVSKPRFGGDVAIYSCAKAAIHEYTIHLANQMNTLHPDQKIKVNCIATDGKSLPKINIGIKSVIESEVNGQIIRLEN